MKSHLQAAHFLTSFGFSAAALLAITALWILLRIDNLGHLLVWDEAMQICSLRSFASHGGDSFSLWMWRHPPFYSLIMALFAPLQAGYATRIEVLNIAISLINMGLLFSLNRRLLGVTTALWSVLFVATLPGAIFFDTWIKGDHLVTTFGLASLLFVSQRHSLRAGLALGVAFLCKETAVFYALTAAVLWMTCAARNRLKGLLLLMITTILTSGWWFALVFFGSFESSGGTISHFRFASGSDAGWIGPWYTYLKDLPVLLGPIGMLLASIGTLSVLWMFVNKPLHQAEKSNLQLQGILWPVILILPSYAFISAIPPKVHWIVISLLPAWATLAAMGVNALMDRFNEAKCRGDHSALTLARATLSAAIAIAVISGAWAGKDFESTLQRMDRGQWSASDLSRTTAEAVNRLMADDDRVLITSFHYWSGIRPGLPCAVFTASLIPKIQVLLKPCSLGPDEAIDLILRHKIKWAVLSPPPGEMADKLFSRLSGLGLQPVRLPGAYIFKTDSLLATTSPLHSSQPEKSK